MVPISVLVPVALVMQAWQEATYGPNYSVTSYGVTRLLTAFIMLCDSAVRTVSVATWGWGACRGGGLYDVLRAPEVLLDTAGCVAPPSKGHALGYTCTKPHSRDPSVPYAVHARPVKSQTGSRKNKNGRHRRKFVKVVYDSAKVLKNVCS